MEIMRLKKDLPEALTPSKTTTCPGKREAVFEQEAKSRRTLHPPPPIFLDPSR